MHGTVTGMQSDEQLVRHALQGRADDFGALVKRYYRLVYGIAFAYTGSSTDAEDLSQESFLKAYRSLDTLREIGRFRAWLIRIVRNECHDWRARQGRDRPPAAAETQVPETATPDVETKELFEFLWRELEGLDDTSREILTIYYFLGKNTREMARHLDISVSAAEKRLQRARHVLGERLAARLDDALEPFRPDEGNAQRAAHAVIALPVAWNSVNVAALLGTGEAATTLSFGTVITWVFVIAVVGSASLLVYSKRMQDRVVMAPEDGGPAVAAEASNRENERQAPEISTDEAEDKGNAAVTTTGTPDLTVYVSTEGAEDSPIPGATVTVFAPPQGKFLATTDKDGAAVFYDIPWGDLGIVVSHNQYVNKRFTYDLERSESSLYVALTRGQTIAGQVIAGDTGEPITDFSIQLLGTRSSPDKPVTESPVAFHHSQGRFSISNIMEATLVVASSANYVTKATSLRKVDDWGNILLVLDRAVVVEGRVHDTRGQAIAGARVELMKRLGTSSAVQTTEDGIFQAAITDTGVRLLAVTHENFVTRFVPTGHPQKARVWLDIELARAASVRGVVRYDGKLWPDALISFQSRDSNAVRSNERGEYVVTGLRPGPNTIVASLSNAPGEPGYFADAGQLVSLEEGQQATLDFNFEPATSSIIGYVSVPNTEADQYDVSVTAEITGSAGSEIRRAKVDPGELYVFENVPAGRAALTAEVVFAGGAATNWRQVMIEVPPDSEIQQDFTFTPSASVQVRVAGIPEGYRGELRLFLGRAETWDPEARVPVAGYHFVQSDGDVSFQPLDPGIYTLVLRMHRYDPTMGRVGVIGQPPVSPWRWFNLSQPHRVSYWQLGPYPSGPDAAMSVVEVVEGETATVQLSVSL